MTLQFNKSVMWLALANLLPLIGITVLLWRGTAVPRVLAVPAQVWEVAGNPVAQEQPATPMDLVRDQALMYGTRKFYRADAVAVAQMPPPDFVLNGTIAIPGKPRVALLSNKVTGEAVRVKAGENLADWLVREVESRRVLLEYGQQHAEISLPGAGAASGLTMIAAPRAASSASGVRILGGGSGGAVTAVRGQVEARLYQPPRQ